MSDVLMPLKSGIKSLIIFALAVLTVYQVSTLWFVNITNRNFFAYFEARFATSAPDGLGRFVQPKRIISTYGDGVFAINYMHIDYSDEWEYTTRAIEAVLRNGIFSHAAALDFDVLLNRPSLIFEYAFDMDPAIFANAFNLRTGVVLTNQGIAHFNTFVIQPPMQDDNTLRIHFIHGQQAFTYTLSQTGRRDPSNIFPFEMQPVSTEGLNFKQHGTQTSLILVPHAPRSVIARPIMVINPYENQFGALHLSFIRNRVEPFFDNPATINFGVSADGIYTFNNLNTVVRYLATHVIDYTSFRPIGRTTSTTFIDDFSSALSFIHDDVYMINDFYLSSFETRGRENIFRFNFVIENFPLVMPPWPTGANCNNPLITPIEVVVDNGRVVHYRRLAFNFIADTDRNNFFNLLALRQEYGEDIIFSLVYPISTEPSLKIEAYFMEQDADDAITYSLAAEVTD